MYAVILAGGGGTRLWPLSRPDRPKPFLPLIDERTLLQHTVDRLRPIHRGDVFVVTHRRYADLVREQLPEIGGVIEEPEAKNTAAAIALATAAINRPDNEVMAVLPADQSIRNEDLFAATLMNAGGHGGLADPHWSIDAPLATLGIQIDRAATEYGYLLPDAERRGEINGLTAYPLLAFEEKPTQARAAALFRKGGGVAWNAGIFLWRRASIRDALDAFQPSLLDAVASPALEEAYRALPPISIDYAVMEPAAAAGRVVMGAMDVGWSDLGGWSALLEGIEAEGTGRVIPAGENVVLGPRDLMVHGDAGRLVVTQGPSGTIRTDGPAALLLGAAGHRHLVEALLDRVAAREAQLS